MKYYKGKPTAAHFVQQYLPLIDERCERMNNDKAVRNLADQEGYSHLATGTLLVAYYEFKSKLAGSLDDYEWTGRMERAKKRLQKVETADDTRRRSAAISEMREIAAKYGFKLGEILAEERRMHGRR